MGSALAQNLNMNKRDPTHQLAQENSRENAPDGVNLLLPGFASGAAIKAVVKAASSGDAAGADV